MLLTASLFFVHQMTAILVDIDAKFCSQEECYDEIHVRGLNIKECNETKSKYFEYTDTTMKLIGRVIEEDEQAVTIETNLYIQDSHGKWQLIMQPVNVIVWNKSSTICIAPDSEFTISAHKN